ncbi:hypothetical protein CONPUDRAFT_74088 [Coniophora puteana RWD-64-598 SS2]|uniref:BTB domain-containing protein n=1 Tax=Coniophora puteana (strain RWD-64-598) TaxID=741705 RepID=A0A5M3MKX3_CONPW|nr:uncharacterized protein CONPUDRAFT_74088 [Coniophora puteana RWD-64-598 SS2]EIW79733.1 hypothetical protein CONPUDRAFT_74088 [Coniophora puteana RWD-64-598 SS2]
MASPRIATAPFDASDADIVFRTSDDVDFRLHRIILALASPIFKDMLGLPQPPSDDDGKSLPIVPVSESSRVLEPLLLFCYPAPPPVIDTLNDACLILDAAAKYDIICVQKAMAIHVSSQRFMDENTVGVYCLACRYGWEQVAKSAALCCLKIRSLGRPSMLAEEMRLTTAIAYHRLLVYHAECGKVACALGRENFQWLAYDSRQRGDNCHRCNQAAYPGSTDIISLQAWLKDALHAVGGELLERPDSTTVITSSQFDVQTKNYHQCNDCIQLASRGRFSAMKEVFAQQVREEIGKGLSKVELEFE